MDGLIARAYIRVSTDEQAQTGYSLPAQRERLHAFADSQGWTIVKVYEDEGQSAKDMNRPALQQMLKEAQPGEVILTYKLDRLTRSVVDLYELMKLFEQRGLLFKSATEEFNTTTPHGRLMITLVAVLAQWERETIAERAKMGKQKKAASGEWPGGPVPFGYQAVPSGKIKGGRNLLKLVPDPDTAPVVPEIFRRYLSGQGVRGIAMWLNERGIRAKKGGRWAAESVKRILLNPMFCGDIEYGRRTNGPSVWIRDVHQPLVSREVFEQVRELFDRRKEVAPRQATGKYPLTGIARCGACGGGIAMAVSHDGGYYYRCLRYVKGKGCGNRPLTSFPGHLAESSVVAFIDRLQRPGHLEEFTRQWQQSHLKKLGVDDKQIRQLETELRECRQAIKRWDQAYETGHMELTEYLARVQPHKDRISTIQHLLERVKKEPEPLPKEDLASHVLEFRRVWGLASAPQRKVLLENIMRAIGGRILLYPDQEVRVVPAE